MKEPEFMWDKDGRIARRWWDNVFCCCCGSELTPSENYGEGPECPGICLECGRIIINEIEHNPEVKDDLLLS